MNKIYRTVWNDITRTWIAVAENVRRRRKGSSGIAGALFAGRFLLKPLCAALAALGVAQAAPPNPPAAGQLPSGGNVVAGQAAISQSGASMTIRQGSQRAAIDWQTFNVGSAARVTFEQPSASSVTLNRVLDSNPSQIFGRISAPGQVFLSNPNGIYFAPGASVDVGGLVATTHSLGTADFMAGNSRFTRNGASGSVVNEGSLNAALGGYIALLAPEVRNHGVIVAQLGSVALAAGETYDLSFSGSRLTEIRVEPATIAALVENGNAVIAPGGLIVLSAQAANRLQGGVINNSGTLEASGLTDQGGVVRLEASDNLRHSGSIHVDAAAGGRGSGGRVTLIAALENPQSSADINGEITAKAGNNGGDGGYIETSGGRVYIGQQARVSTAAPAGQAGTWVIDPTDFTISAGTAAQTTSGIGVETLQTALAAGNVSILTSNTANGSDTGVINVNADLAWNAHTLTLRPHGGLNVNAVMSASGTSVLSLSSYWGTSIATPVNIGINPGGSFKGRIDFGGRSGTGFFSNGSNAYYVLNSLGADGSVSGADLQGMAGNLSGKFALGANIDASASAGWSTGFTPVGNASGAFTGTFDGLGHTIDGLTVKRSGSDYNGLFGKIGSQATLRNVGLTNVSITGAGYSGALVGHGGNTGAGYGVKYSFATGTVNGSSAGAGRKPVGGLVGGYGSVTSSFADVAVSGKNYVGGLIGISSITPINKSFAKGNVSGTGYGIGGLVGYGNYASVNNSYASGSVTGPAGQAGVGGLIGKIRTNVSSSVTNNYSVGAVNASAGGGLIGQFSGTGTISNNFWDTQTSGKATSAGGAGVSGKTSAQMSDSTTFSGAGWDTTTVWKINSEINNGRPFLCSVTCQISLFLKAITGSSIYGEVPGITYGYYLDAAGTSPVANASPSGTPGWTNAPDSSSAVGTYALTYNGGVSVGNSDYQLVAGNAVNWSVTPRPITITANSGQGKVYGEADPTLTYTLEANSSGRGLVGSDSFSGALNRAGGENVGNSYAIGQGTLANGNYSISFVGDDFAITPRPITITANSGQGKVYGEADPTLTYTLEANSSGRGLVGSDSFSGALNRVGGENVGNSYAIGQGTLVSGNYSISFVGDNFAISRRPVNLTAEAKDKTAGVPDPALTYLVEAPGAGRGLLSGDNLSGSLTRVAGEGAGDYAIEQGTVDDAHNGNYAIAYMGAVLRIDPAAAEQPGQAPYVPVPPLPAPVMPKSSSPLGDAAGGSGRQGASPAPVPVAGEALVSEVPASVPATEASSVGTTPSASGGVKLSLVQEPGVQQVGIISVSVPGDLAASGAGFRFSLPEKLQQGVSPEEVKVTMATGKELPEWLHYVPENYSFVAGAVPDSAFPVQVVVMVKGQSTTIVISERK